VSEQLSAIFHQAPSSYTAVDKGRTRLDMYLRRKSDWSAAKRSQLDKGLAHISACGLDLENPRISFSKLPLRDWAESWKGHFKPIEINRALLIKPSWSKRRPRRGQAVVVLDPGLSFGTGQHPTTAFCLSQIVVRRWHNEQQSFLDIGTGSGILAVAAAKLGYAPILAFDVDPDAVRIARTNARENGVASRIRFLVADASRLTTRGAPKYSVVCANISTHLLLEENPRIVAQLASGGLLILAGVLKQEFAGVHQAYEAAGLRLIKARTEKEWRSGSFKKNVSEKN
jgi:ribosomal protein L11 methyltransferase